MAKSLAYVAAALSLFAVTAPADAKGCIRGAIVGGVAGHFAGHHGALGAAAGCVIGHHEANKPTNPQPSTTEACRGPPRGEPRLGRFCLADFHHCHRTSSGRLSLVIARR